MWKWLVHHPWLNRALIVLPPVLFLLYAAHSLVTIRSLMKDSSQFHLDYANDLIQDYLATMIALELERLHNGIDPEPDALDWLSEISVGEPVGELTDPIRPIYLNRERLPDILPEYFHSRKGLSALFSRLTELHEPVYWFRIIDPEDETIYTSGNRPGEDAAMAVYPMDRSLNGYKVEICYNSFGARQLYTVSRQKINFGLIFILFVMMIFSGVLFTRNIRQKILLARQKTFFVSTVSHEFKTPLAIMKLASETLEAKRYKTPEDEKKFLTMMINEINRLNHLVQKILNFNKIEMGQVRYHNQDTDLRHILESGLPMFRAKAASENVVLEEKITAEPCPIHGDAELIRHALDNIIDNAFKYRGDSNHINVICERDGEEIRLIVKDQGVGIAPDDMGQIFKSFYRADDPKTRGIRGSGLGLAISNDILKNSGARMTVDSTLGKGSTFTVTFNAN